ncbi:MAG: hypothetical protein JRN09_02325 [Nitrososphaerota archaeon]|jgi:hypothetical protein|nr:hypothetical protein [Nitrososphaerota archaeon]
MHELSEQVAAILKERLEIVPNQSVAAKAPGGKKVPRLPFVFVYTPEFTFEDSGVGGGGAQVSEEVQDSKEGDGKTVNFKLSQRAQRPLTSVESPPGTRLAEGTDFVVNYVTGRVTFQVPPKEEAPIVFRYLSAASAGRTRTVRLHIVCHIDVWGEDETSVDDIVLDVIKGMVLSQEALAGKGIQLKPSKGFILGQEDGLPDEIFAQRVVYTAEIEVQAKESVPRIESIEVRQKPPV